MPARRWLWAPVSLAALDFLVVERRYILFALISFAVLMGSQVLQNYLFPRQPVPQQVAVEADPTAPGGSAPPAAAGTPKTAVAQPATEAAIAGIPEATPATSAPRIRHSLGSLDPASPAQMLVTLTSRGAAVERIELSGGQFHDQDDRHGYLGHLALKPVEGGCQIGVIGAGTPAALAGLQVGDTITRINGSPAADAEAVLMALATTDPNDTVTIDLLRDGSAATREVKLDRRPLEVVRPEYRTLPVENPDSMPCDPLSFRLSLESLDGKTRREPLDELPGLELTDRDWVTEPLADGQGVRFSTSLPGGLKLAKVYRLVVQGEGGDMAAETGVPGKSARLELNVELSTDGGPASISYALDGPTGLPTEGWWYTARIARDWGTLAVRDMAMRFAGEQSTLVSGLKMADKSLPLTASAVREGKPLSFAGVDALYFAAALLPATTGENVPALAEVRPLVVGDVPEAARRKLVNVSCRLVSRPLDLVPGTPVTHRYEIFAGPKKPDLLSRFGAKGATMDDLVYYGWFGWVARPMIAILHAFHAVIGNYGIAILLLTVAVRGAMYPVSRKQAVSAQKMQVLQPEMKAIAEKYKDDAEKRTKATQELWRKHDYNPAGGCLLVFLQIPIFMGLYRSLATDVELRQAPLFSSAMRWCSNLAAPDMFYDWSQLLPPFLTAPEGWLGPFLNLFPLATIGLFLWQQHLFMPPAVDEQAKVQQQVMKYMMFFMALMFFKVPCGLCLYFIASSLWGIAERLMLPTAPVALAGVPSGPEPTKAKGFFENPFAASARNGTHVADELRRKRQARKKR